ncbi:putative monothiol glutaredoxin ycf64-like [Tubulanus polymorphus]|uniref:putative monothiol glutaredoxin ycf64-like n=1 Tax=Tubulanus polymorphus TaxID=672921 RepID=UPI003DA5AD84
MSFLVRSALQSFKVTRCLNLSTLRYCSSNATIHDKIDKLVKNNKIVLFMKGVPEAPRCGFSNLVIRILEMHGVDNFDAHDVLEDEVLRQGIKDFSQWPTIPQVYIDGEFLGGSDIMLDMHKNGELVEELKKIGIKSALLDAPKA